MEPATKLPLFKVSGLKKYFPIYKGLFRRQVGVIRAVDDVDFTVLPGEVTAIVGESGSGKSTAARAAVRLIEPTAGKMELEGRCLMTLTPSALKALRKEIQIIFQDPYGSLNPRKKIFEAIGEPLLYHQLVKTKEEQQERVAFVLKQVGLSLDHMGRYPHQLSGGQQQRVCIGRAIAFHPKLIICDEAVSALDVSIQAQILNLLIELKEKFRFSYLFISHNLAVVRHIADHVVVFHQGRVIESQRADKLFAAPQNPYTQQLLRSVPKICPSINSPL